MRHERARPRRGLPGRIPVGPGLLLALLACGPTEGADADPEGAGTPRAAAEGRSVGQDTGGGGGEDAGAAPAADPTVRTVRITVAGHPVTVEVADDEEERQRGLMFRDSLPDSHGMLFVYEDQKLLSFWMRNTRIPLDVAFIDRSGRIVDIQQMEPMTDDTHTSRAPALYALEMRLGWFEEHGVEVGDTVEF